MIKNVKMYTVREIEEIKEFQEFNKITRLYLYVIKGVYTISSSVKYTTRSSVYICLTALQTSTMF